MTKVTAFVAQKIPRGPLSWRRGLDVNEAFGNDDVEGNFAISGYIPTKMAFEAQGNGLCSTTFCMSNPHTQTSSLYFSSSNEEPKLNSQAKVPVFVTNQTE